MTDLTPERLKELRRIAEHALPKQWFAVLDPPTALALIDEITALRSRAEAAEQVSECCQESGEACGPFIAEERRAEAAEAEVARLREARSLAEWCEDDGPVLWWAFPIQEPPYSGSPLDTDWPGYHTHWTPIIDGQRWVRAIDWQPIATAPKDGRTVLVAEPIRSNWWWISSAKYDVYEGGWWAIEERIRPTHWRPLPSPPADSER